MMSEGKRTLIVGTRASKLALWQTNFVIQKLRQLFPDLQCRIQTFKTIGDDIVDRPLPELGGKGVFTARLEQALLGQDVDIAVHSLKDLPIEVTPGLALGAITSRVDVRDVLVTRYGETLQSLPKGAHVGTSSLRRQAQLLLARPDLTMRQIRGNVETRIRKVKSGDYDATVLAAAGVDRLGFTDAVSDRLSLDLMLPAPGQGALAIQCRADDNYVLDVLAAIDNANDRATVTAERAFLAGLGGGCAAPVAAFAQVGSDGHLEMTALVANPDGSGSVRVQGDGPDAEALGAQLAEKAISQGAKTILDDAQEALDAKQPLKGKRVVVTRAVGQNDEFCNALSALGATPVRIPLIRIVPLADKAMIEQVGAEASPGDWVIFTSANGVSAVWRLTNGHLFEGMRVAAVGPRTAGALQEHRITPDYVPERYTGVSVAEGMPDVSGRNVWLLRAETAGEEIINALTDRGAAVHDLPVYRTEPETIDESGFAELEKGVDVITFTSGSTVHNFKAACDRAGKTTAFLEKAVVACIGPVTAKTARELGFKVDLVAGEHTASSLVDVLANHFSEVS